MKLTKIFRIKVVFIILLLIGLIGIYQSNFFMIQIPAKVQSLTEGRIKLWDATNAIMSFVDDINPFVGKMAIESVANDVDSINIIFSNKNARKFQSMKSKSYSTNVAVVNKNSVENEFINCELNIDGDIYEAKIKFHSRGYSDLSKNQYRIMLKKEKLYDNMRTFSLLHFGKSNAQSAFMYDLYNKYLNVEVKHKIVHVKINSVDQGFYFLEERLGKELLERNNMPGHDILKFNNTWDHQYNKNFHNPPYVYDPASFKYYRNSELNIGQIYKAEELLDFRNNPNYKQLLDLNYLAMYEALRTLYGDHHSIVGDNFKLIYSTSNGLFYPFLRTEHLLEKLTENTLSNNFEQSLFEGNALKNNFLRDIIQDDDFRNLRNKNLKILLDNKDELLKEYNLLDENFLKYSDVDITNQQPTKFYEFTAKRLKDNLIHNFNKIEEYLYYGKILVRLYRNSSSSYILEVTPDVNAPVIMTSLSVDSEQDDILIKTENNELIDLKNIGQLSQYGMQLGLNGNLEPKIRKYKFEIISSNNLHIEDIDTSFLNTITNKPIPKIKILKTISHFNKNNFYYPTLKQFFKKYQSIKFSINNKNIIFPQGKVIIEEDIILPHGYNLVIKQGTILKLAPNKSVLVYGNLVAQGTKQNPVIVTNLVKNKPFGVIAAIGDKQSNVYLNHLNLSGGSEAMINGIYLSGALSLYSHKKVVIKDSHIHHNSADDGLNIKNSEVLIEDNIFEANLADQVDLDLCNGYVNNNKFISDDVEKDFDWMDILQDDNGDGLDFSGSNVIVNNNDFYSFPDKGISVGEKSKVLVRDNTFTNNKSAVTVKDQSNAYMFNNAYVDNLVNIEMYQKKKIFKSPSLYNINEKYHYSKITKTDNSHYYKLDESALDEIVEMINGLNPNVIFDTSKQNKWIERE
jgi:hypothetical protein